LLAASDTNPGFSPNDRDVAELRPCPRGDLRGFAQTATPNVAGSFTNKEMLMNWDQIRGNWMQFRSEVRMNWVKLREEDLTRIDGHREVLARTLQARYGFARAEAEREIDAWLKTQRHAA